MCAAGAPRPAGPPASQPGYSSAQSLASTRVPLTPQGGTIPQSFPFNRVDNRYLPTGIFLKVSHHPFQGYYYFNVVEPKLHLSAEDLVPTFLLISVPNLASDPIPDLT